MPCAMKRLHLETDESAFHVVGGHFRFRIGRQHGLIEEIDVKGDRWSDGPVPDLWASEAVDPRPYSYAARHTADAAVCVEATGDQEIIVAASGRLAGVDGRPFPLRYHIRYTFQIDGTVAVDVAYEAGTDLVVRWLALCQARIRLSTCRFVAREADLAASGGAATCRPSTRLLERQGGWQEGGRFVPWWHFGNDRTGLEFVFAHSEHSHSGWTDSSPYPTGDPLGRAGDLYTGEQRGHSVQLTAYLVRNLREPLAAGERLGDRFYLSVVPGRAHDPRADDLRIAWTGPHQYRSGWRPPDEAMVQRWADQGANWVIGGVNWFSGDYSRPADPEATQRFLDHCHRHGLRVMPYVTFTDMEYGAPGFDQNDGPWRIEPVSEFNYRSHLMCYGSAGWQARWRDEVAAIFRRFAFDGLYIDFWAGRLLCRNARHGCSGPYGRFTAEGLRQMARFARETVRAASPDGLILANTNILPLAMINNWIDARLYGEWHNLEETDSTALRVFYNARRFGTGSVLLVSQVPAITRRTVALAETFQGSPVLTHARSPAERTLLREHARLKADFGVDRAAGWNHFELQDALGDLLPLHTRASLFFHPERQDMLLALINAGTAGPLAIPLTQLLARIEAAVLRPAGFTLPDGRGELWLWEDGREVEEGEISVPPEDVRHVWVRSPALGQR